jgi:adenylylsulfate kinase
LDTHYIPPTGYLADTQAAMQAYLVKYGSKIDAVWLNADRVREEANDWDFSIDGRLRQAKRINDLANKSNADYVIADFIAPTKESRSIFNPDILIWVDTVKSSKYPDTDIMFENPTNYKFKITKKDAQKEALKIFNYLKDN